MLCISSAALLELANHDINNKRENSRVLSISCFMMLNMRNLRDVEHAFEEIGSNGEVVEVPLLERRRRLFKLVLTSKNFYFMLMTPVVAHFECNVWSVPQFYQSVVYAELPLVLVLIYLIGNFFRWRQLTEPNNNEPIASYKGIFSWNFYAILYENFTFTQFFNQFLNEFSIFNHKNCKKDIGDRKKTPNSTCKKTKILFVV